MKTIYTYTKFTFLLLLLLLVSSSVKSQSNFQNESEMKAKAAEYFSKNQFKKAFPLYSQLLSLNAKNPELNYRFGVCLLYTDRSKPEAPLKYLEKAINKVTEVDFYYHLAYAYQNNYFFTDAINNYRKYLQLARNKARKDYEVNRKISQCQNGMDMLKAADDLYVMQKTEVPRENFYRSYNLANFGGRFLNLPEEYLSKADLKSHTEKVTFFNPKGKLLLYSLENKNQKDLYYRRRLNNGEWSQAFLLSSNINTKYDEDYPFLMPDGKTLYFSSKGHNTMGGYDIFRSVYDSISRKWSKPTNLSFPFNTPSDDIFFIVNADETMAWFASNRASIDNKVSVYKVGIIKKEKTAKDFSDVYANNHLSENDLGKIRSLAALNINISDKEFHEIPVNQKQKLDALQKNEAKRITQNIHQANLNNIDNQIAVQEMQTGLSDSVKIVVQGLEDKMETLKSLYLNTQKIIDSKSSALQLAHDDLKQILTKAQQTTNINKRKIYIEEANKKLFSTLRLDFQHQKILSIQHQINNQITSQRRLFTQANTLFGNIQKNIVTRNDLQTKQNINRLDQLIRKADTLKDYTKVINYSTGNFYSLNYPSNLIDVNDFNVYYLEDERDSSSPILATETRFAALIPEVETNANLEILKNTEERVSAARLKSKKLSYQLKLSASLLVEKKKRTTTLFQEASNLVKSQTGKPTQENLDQINRKFAEARKSAYETHLAKQIYEELKNSEQQAKQFASRVSHLKESIELASESRKNQDVERLYSELKEVDQQILKLPDYEKRVDFNTKKLRNVKLPDAIKDKNSFMEYSIQQGQLQRRTDAAFQYDDVNSFIANSELLPQTKPQAEKRLVESVKQQNKTTTPPKIEANSSQLIRQQLAEQSQQQDKIIAELKKQSNLLTTKAAEKLDSSNKALLEFEQMREKYRKGEIKDQKAVLAKQTESQNLLYQSLAIKIFVEKTDSILLLEQSRRKEATNQIFAIEQALKSEQIDKAQALFHVFKNNKSQVPEPVESLVEEWIDTEITQIDQKQNRANQAFENSQKLTDESIKLLMESKQLKEEAKNKTNAFKRRQINVEATNKEALAIKKQNQADEQLALGTHLFEEIKKAKALAPIAHEFSVKELLAVDSKPILQPEKRKKELNERLVSREQTPAQSISVSPQTTGNKTKPKLDFEKISKINDLTAYKSKHYKAQLLADELDINKRETVVLIKAGKSLKGEASKENRQKITALRKEADSLQNASEQAFIEANNTYKQLNAQDKKEVDKGKNTFEDYLKNVKNRIAQLLDDVTLLGEQARASESDFEREALRQKADDKEQIAMYLILEEYEIIAQRNQQNYRKNALIINQLYNQKLSDDERRLMNAVLDKVKRYRTQADTKREKAKAKELSFQLKKVLLQDAFSKESAALDLQLEAIRMMREKDTQSMLAYQPKASQEKKSSVQRSVQNTNSEKNKAVETKNSLANTQVQTAEKKRSLEKNTSQALTLALKTKEEKTTNKALPQKTQTQKQKPVQHSQAKTNKEATKLALAQKEAHISTMKENSKPQEKTKIQTNRIAQESKNTVSNKSTDEIQKGVAKQANRPSKAKTKIYPLVRVKQQTRGTQFSVQIAAIRGLKTTDNFLNVIELFSLKDPKKDLYRYYSGQFSNLKAAIIRRNSLRMQGYSDAFIKSWKEGKEVSMFEAAGKLDKETLKILHKTTIALPSKYRNINFKATNISQLNGVYYSVQVGVYSRPRSSVQLFGIKPLYHNRMDNGYWVYFNGIFKSISSAEENKNSVRSKGVKDAFVVAFKEGKKVGVSVARKALSQGNLLPTDNDIIMLDDAASKIDNQLKTIIKDQPRSTSKKKKYKIQIGVYSHPVSFEWLKNAMQLSDEQSINYFVSASGKYVYTLGEFKTHNTASKFNQQKVKKWIKDAFIVSFSNGKKNK